MYVLFEGVDGVGKSTQIEMIARAHEDSLVTKEPGGTKIGQKLREILLGGDFKLSTRAEILLFLADRAEHYQKMIKPNSGRLILSDRGFVSGVAYALANDASLKIDDLLWLNSFALEGKFADKIVFFEAGEALIKKRLSSRGLTDAIEARGLKYLLKVQECMKEVLKAHKFNVLHIDASEDIATINAKIENFIKF